ncbi:MAG: EcoRV family type II restriction endonuclease, partial [Lachnospiraceae bacterium]|nr:EcoRV family type II restriction endonuclease [Lachnospiraceae bacterium]
MTECGAFRIMTLEVGIPICVFAYITENGVLHYQKVLSAADERLYYSYDERGACPVRIADYGFPFLMKQYKSPSGAGETNICR